MTTTITLNPIIFNHVLKYLLINEEFKRLLEYSLLSKFIFKVLSNQLKHYSNVYLPILSFQSLQNYIDNVNSYQYKLLQFKETEYLSITNPNDQKLKSIYKFLKLNCPNLKSTRLFNQFETSFYTSYERNGYKKDSGDDSFNGFFTFENVVLVWSITSYPISNKEEASILKDYNELELICHPFTFEFLNNIQPRKLYLDTYSHNGRYIDLYKIGNILNQQSIETIKFMGQLTTLSFFKKALSLKNLKSLSVNLPFNGDEIPFEIIISKENDGTGNDSSFENIGSGIDLNSILKSSGLVNNTSLKRLRIRGRGETKGINPKYLFHLLSNNNQLKALGLEIYNIKNQELLKPLNQFTSVTVLYCNIESTEHFLLHILGNSNIKHLKFKVTNNNNFIDYSNIFTTFFQQNKTLESISIISGANDIIPNFAVDLIRLSRTFKGSICKVKNKFKNEI